MKKSKDKGLLLGLLIVAGAVAWFTGKGPGLAEKPEKEYYVISPLPELNLAEEVTSTGPAGDLNAEIARTSAIAAGQALATIRSAADVSPMQVLQSFEYYAKNLPPSPAAARALAAASPFVLNAIFAPVTPNEAYVQSLTIPQAQAAYKQVEIAQESVKAFAGGSTDALRRLLVGY